MKMYYQDWLSGLVLLCIGNSNQTWSKCSCPSTFCTEVEELTKARVLVNDFLEKNQFEAGKPNSKRVTKWFCCTYPLHEAVKQQNAYIASKLLMFGADPSLKDMWGWNAYDYAKLGRRRNSEDTALTKIFEHHRNKTIAQQGLAGGPGGSRNRLQRYPPPMGFEEFFAKVEQDPLVQVPSSEAAWLDLLGQGRVRVRWGYLGKAHWQLQRSFGGLFLAVQKCINLYYVDSDWVGLADWLLDPNWLVAPWHMTHTLPGCEIFKLEHRMQSRQLFWKRGFKSCPPTSIASQWNCI